MINRRLRPLSWFVLKFAVSGVSSAAARALTIHHQEIPRQSNARRPATVGILHLFKHARLSYGKMPSLLRFSTIKHLKRIKDSAGLTTKAHLISAQPVESKVWQIG